MNSLLFFPVCLPCGIKLSKCPQCDYQVVGQSWSWQSLPDRRLKTIQDFFKRWILKCLKCPFFTPYQHMQEHQCLPQQVVKTKIVFFPCSKEKQVLKKDLLPMESMLRSSLQCEICLQIVGKGPKAATCLNFCMLTSTFSFQFKPMNVLK